MKKVIFIIPYFGIFPPYFSIWLKTAGANPTIDFLIITDIDIKNSLSPNIKVLHWSFKKLQNFFQTKFDFKICLDNPYKVCDFRPSFGYVFYEYIKEYDFWGNCDIDCVFGDLRKFLDPLLDKYDAIGKYGHLSLYKNEEFINQCFKKEGSLYSYIEVFSNHENYAFDEVTGIKRIFKIHDVNCKFEIDSMADIKKMHKGFQIGHSIKNYKKQVFLWDEGRVFQCFLNNKTVNYKEFMYLHFQKKSPVPELSSQNGFYIFYDSFLPREDSGTDKKMLDYHRVYNFYMFRFFEKVSWICKRIVQLLFEDKKQRKIYNYKRKFQ